MQPIMKVEASCPMEFHELLSQSLQKRNAVITGTRAVETYFVIECEVGPRLQTLSIGMCAK